MQLFLLLLQHTSDFSTSVEGHAYNPPDNLVYYAVLIVSSVIVLATIIYSVKWTIWPGEQADNHIKRKILEMDQEQL